MLLKGNDSINGNVQKQPLDTCKYYQRKMCKISNISNKIEFCNCYLMEMWKTRPYDTCSCYLKEMCLIRPLANCSCYLRQICKIRALATCSCYLINGNVQKQHLTPVVVLWEICKIRPLEFCNCYLREMCKIRPYMTLVVMWLIRPLATCSC